jgi:S-adenosylmethionine hydrolase
LTGRVDSAGPLITLLTDFGLVDPYVAEMKGAILTVCPEARIVDVTHGVDKYDVGMGAFLLAEAASFFPEGTVHVGVVDPGVGSSRRPMVVKARRGLFVGPDNGLLIPAAQTSGIVTVHEITNRFMMLPDVSSTFHGRDIFAPTAAHLACGHLPEECGPKVTDYVKSPYGESVVEGKWAVCRVLHVDGFGNIVTNLTRADLNKLHLTENRKIILTLNGRRLTTKITGTFSDLRKGEIGLILGSHGFYEIVCREASAGKRLRIKRGTVVRVSG